MKNVLITVIIPVYKVECFLRRCLDSVINQTYRNLDIVIIDDGSPDKCGEICEEYAVKDSRIKTIHQENAGLAAARNVGLDMAIGDYVLFVDSDDWIEKDTCEKVLSIAKDNNAELVFFGIEDSFPSGKIKNRVVSVSGELEKKYVMENLLWGKGVIHNEMTNKFFCKSLFDNIRFPIGRIYEDGATLYKLVHKANRIIATNCVLYHYIHREESINSDRYKSIGIISLISSWKERLIFYQDFYPEFVNKQKADILREMLIGKELLKKTADYDSFIVNCKEYMIENKSFIKHLTGFSRIIWLYYYCRPLSFLYIKWRFGKYSS